jgi:hypothetical protein
MHRMSRRKVILAISLILWLLAGEAVAQGWYNSSWLYRKKITIDYTKVGSTGAPHASFPVLVNISDADLSSKARSDGYDILFTSNDGTTSLPYEREKYTSGTGALVAWVQIPSLSATANTDIYMYYGNSGAADQQNGTGTWETNFKAVWHLAETTGGTGASQDATSNGNNGTPRGTQANLGIASQIDGGVTLNGTNDYISTTTQYSNPQTLTVSIWFKTTSASGHKMIGFENSQTGTGSANADRQIWIGADGKVRAGVYNGSVVEIATTGTYTDGNWHYVAFTHASNTLTLYMDGASVSSAGTSGAQNFSGYFRIGSYRTSGWTSASNGYFGGSVDEARLAFTARSAGWILTEYNNQSSPSTFYSVASEEQPTKTWDGGAGTNNWGDAANWNPDGVPTSTNDVSLTGANTININVAAAAKNLTLNNASLTLTIQSAYSLTVSGDLTITTGTLNTQASFPTVSGTVSIAGGTVGYTASSGSQTVAAQPYNNLTISGGGTKTLGGSITPSGNLTISSGTFDLSSYTANRASSGGTLTVSNGATLSIGGTGTLPSNYSTHSIGATSTINYAGTSQTVAILNSSQNYGHLTISGSGTKTLAGTENVAGNLSISAGTFDLGSYTINRASAGGTLTVSNGATLSIGGTGTLPSNYSTHSIGSTSTINYAGTTQTVAVLNSSQNYGHLIISGSGTKTLAGTENVAGNLSISAGTFDLGSYTINRASAGGTLTVSSGASLKIGGTGSIPSNYSTHSVGSTSTIEYAGTNQSVAVLNSSQNYGNLTISGSGTKTLAGAETVNGTLTLSAGTLADAGFTLTVNGNVSNSASHTGAGKISLTGGSTTHTLSGAGSYTNLQLNDANGATLSSNLTINGTLTFTTGTITTSSYTVSISSTGTVSRTTGHVVGNLQKYIATGAPSGTFEIGDASNYTPINISFASVTMAGSLTAYTTVGDHPNIGTSTINPSKDVNRYWTLANSGILFTNCSATFNFVSGDVDAGADPSTFLAGRYSSGTWSYPTVGTTTSTSTQATGLTAFGDFALGQDVSAGNYRSAQTGNWGSTSTWQRWTGSSWVAATATPDSSAGIITIRNGHTVTVAASVTVDQVVVEAGGQLTLNSGVTLTIADGLGTDLDVSGTFQSAGTVAINSGATIAFNDGGKYQHNFTTTAGTIPTATWNSGSTCEIIGYTSNTTAPSGLGQSFGNFTYNCPNQTGTLSFASGLTSINGDFRVASTGSGTFRLGSSAVGNLTIGGSFVQTGGTLQFTGGTGAVARTVTVSGDLALSGGTLNMSAASVAGTLNVAGNFSHTAGTITETSTGSGAIVFNGTGTETYTSGGTVSNTINFTVNSGSILQMVADGTTVTGGGTFTLSSGSTLGITSANGITSSAASGNIQVTGARTFNTGANYTYNGSADQVTGDGLPATVNNLTISNSGNTVTLSNGVAVSGTLALSAGTLAVGSNTLTLNGSVTSGGALTSGATGTVSYNQGSAGQTVLAANYGNLTFSNYNKTLPSGTVGIAGTFTAGSATGHTISGSTINFNGSSQSIPAFNGSTGYNNLTISGTGTKTLSVSLNISGDLTVSAGSLDLGSYTANRTSVGGTLTVSSGATLSIGGTGTIPSNYSTHSIGATSTINYYGTTQTISTLNSSQNYGSLTISGSGTATLAGTVGVAGDLTISSGTFDLSSYTANRTSPGGTLTVSNGATLSIGGTGTIPSNYSTHSIGATSTVNYYGTTQTVSTLNSSQNYGNLAISGSGTATPAGTVGVAGDLTISSGTFDLSSYTANRTSPGGTLTVSSGATLSIGGTGTLPSNYSTHSIGTTSTINYAGTTQTVATLNSSQNYGNLTISGSGTKTLAGAETVSGTLTISAGTLADGGFTLSVNGNIANGASHTGAGKISLTGGSTTHTLSGGGPYTNLELNDANGATLNSDVTINGTLTLTSGNVTTSSYTLSIGPTGTVLRTSGYIAGNLQKYISPGATSATFEIGDVNNYTPVNITFSSVSTPGNLTASTTAGDHPNISTSTIDASKSANRYWTLSNSGIAYTDYSATFNFVSGDVDAGANTSSFIVGTYSGGSWIYPSVGTKTTTSTQATGLTAFGDFQIGELLTVYPIGFDAASSATSNGVSGTTLTWSHTVGSYNNLMLIVGVQTEGTSGVQATGVTYAGVALTKVDQAEATSSGYYQDVSQWYLIAPPVGTANVVVTWSASLTDRTAGAISLYNISQQAPEASASNSNNSGTTTTNITTLSDGACIVDMFGSGQGQGNLAPGPDQTQRYIQSSGGTTSGGGSTKYLATAGTTSMTWTQTGINRSAQVVSAYAPAAVGPKTWDGGAGTNNWGDAANWNPDGVPTSGIDVSLAGANTININVTAAVKNLTINNASLALTILSGNSLTVSGNLTLTTGTLNTQASFPSVNGTVSLTGGTFAYTAASGSQTVAVQSYGNLTISGGGTKTLAGNITPSGDLTIAGGTFDLGSYSANRASVGGTLTVSSSATVSIGGTGTLPSNYSTHSIGATSTINYYGTTQTIATLNSSQNYGNLTISSSGTATLASNVGVAGNLTISSGSFDLSSYTANRTAPGGALTVSNGATLLIGGAGTLPSNYSTHSIGGTSTINYSGTSQSVAALSSSQNYGYLTITGSGTKTLAGNVGVVNDLTISSGIFDLGTNTCNRTAAGGILSVSSGATLKLGGSSGGVTGSNYPSNYSTNTLSGTVEFSGVGAQTIPVFSYTGLTFSNAGTKSINSSITATGTATINSGTPVSIASGATFWVKGSMTNAGTVTNSGTVLLQH